MKTKTKKDLIKSVDKLGNDFVSLGIEFKTLSKSLAARKDEFTLKEMKELIKDCRSLGVADYFKVREVV